MWSIDQKKHYSELLIVLADEVKVHGAYKRLVVVHKLGLKSDQLKGSKIILDITDQVVNRAGQDIYLPAGS